MATETRSPGTLANDNSAGTNSWTNASNAASSNDVYATVGGGPMSNSQYLKGTNYSFATIGDSDNLTQLKLRIERKLTSGGTVKDENIYMVIGGAIQTGTNYADTATAYPGTDTYAEYTITTGLPTVAQLKNSGFGFVLKCKDSSGFGWGVSVDHMGEVIATYTPVVAYTATAAGTAAPATGAASCTFAPKVIATAAPIAAHATCAASMVFSASVSIGTAAPTAKAPIGAASMTYTPPHFTAAAACTAAHATAAAQASSIYHATAAPVAAHATCAAVMVYSDPIYAAAAPMTVRPPTCEAVMQTWQRGDWKYTRLTMHQS